MASNHIDWTLGGKKVKPREVKAIIAGFYGDAIQEDVDKVREDLEDLIQRLNNRTSNRGTGFYAVRYNKPFEDAQVEVEEVIPDEVYRIRVKSERKGDSGYKFNVLDAGIPERMTAQPMIFPVYEGTLTKPGGDSFVLNRSSVKVKKPTRWIVTYKVGGAPPRHFYESILNRGQYKNRKKRIPREFRYGDINIALSVGTEFKIIESD